MAKQTINIGTTANDGTGDPLRTAFDKVNSNFTELYNDDAGDVNSIIAGDGISVDTATGNVTITNTITNNNQLINGAGYVDGSGTANKLPKFTDSDTIGNSIVTDNGTGIGINNSNPTEILEVYRAADNSRFKIQNNTFASWVGNDATGFAIETNLFKPIVFKPSGVTAMTLDSSGNVTVNNNLSIGGTLIDSNSSSGTSGQILSSTGTGTDWVSLSEISGVDGSGTANYIAKWTDGDTIGNSVIYDDGTNIGIGTSNPDATLHIVDTGLSVNSGILVQDKSTDATSKYGQIKAAHYSNSEKPVTMMFASIGATSNSLRIGGSYSQENASTEIVFYTASDNTTVSGLERMRIDSAGNVGIGTSSPDSKLHIFGNTGTDAIPRIKLEADGWSNYCRIERSSGADGFYITNNYDTSASVADNTGVGTSGLQMARGDLRFHTGSSGAFAERMRIDSAGNVGIGTTSPSGKLEVVVANNSDGNVSNWTANQFLVTKSGGNTSQGLGFSIDETVGVNTITSLSPNVAWKNLAFRAQELQFYTGGTLERMRITSGGDVLIKNANSPTLVLENTDTSIFTGQTIGELRFTSDDASPINANVANIKVISANNFSTNSTGTHMAFSTCASDSQTATEAIRILPSGGITFNGDTSPANALNDYEEGTWTPNVYGGTTIGDTTYVVQNGNYTKIGRKVTVNGYVAYSSLTGTGELRIGGFPFTSAGGTENYSFGLCIPSGLDWTGGTYITVQINPNQVYARLVYITDNSSAAVQQCVNQTANFRISMTYFV